MSHRSDPPRVTRVTRLTRVTPAPAPPPRPPFQPRPPRRRVDLSRLLTPAARWTLAIVVIVAIGFAGWWTGRDRPVPAWISQGLVSWLGWAYLALAAVALVSWWRRRRAGSKQEDP